MSSCLYLITTWTLTVHACESLLIWRNTERQIPTMKTDCCLLIKVRTRQDIKLHPCFTIYCHYYMTVDDKVKQHGALWWIGGKIWLLASAWCRRRYCQCHAPYGPSWENMTSSTKPEIHNVFQCRQSRTEPWSQVTFAEKITCSLDVVFEICERIDRHYHCTPTSGEVNINRFVFTAPRNARIASAVL